MSVNIPLFKIYWDKQDIGRVSHALEKGMYWAEGPQIREFEERIAKYTKVKYCVVFNSGTSALHAILCAFGIGNGDEIIVPSFTFIATVNAPLFTGAEPVFADIEESNFGLDPSDVVKKITSRTKAIMPVHYGGGPCRIEALKKITREFKLLLIEDAAEAFGARAGAKMAGAFGDAAMFSFCQNKIITTGEGGAAVTSSKSVYEKLQLIRSHGRKEAAGYFSSTHPGEYLELGYNFRMATYVAALGISQLNKAGRAINLRRKNALYYNKILNRQIPGLITPVERPGDFHVYQLYPVRVGRHRDALQAHLLKKGIMTKIYFQPAHLTRFYKERPGKRQSLPVTEAIAKEVLALPMHPGLKMGEMDYVAQQIKIFFKGVKNG